MSPTQKWQTSKSPRKWRCGGASNRNEKSTGGGKNLKAKVAALKRSDHFGGSGAANTDRRITDTKWKR